MVTSTLWVVKLDNKREWKWMSWITNHKWANENYMIAADVGDHHCQCWRFMLFEMFIYWIWIMWCYACTLYIHCRSNHSNCKENSMTSMCINRIEWFGPNWNHIEHLLQSHMILILWISWLVNAFPSFIFHLLSLIGSMKYMDCKFQIEYS